MSGKSGRSSSSSEMSGKIGGQECSKSGRSSSSERSGSCRKVGLVRMKVVAERQEIGGRQE
jgi:hypothetical protein